MTSYFTQIYFFKRTIIVKVRFDLPILVFLEFNVKYH